MTGSTLSRRRFLVGGAGAAVLAAGGAVLVASRAGKGADPVPTTPEGLPGGASPGGVGTVEAVGRRYLEEAPHEGNRETLLAALPPGTRDTSGDDPEPALRTAVTEDFAAGRLVELDGWLLSVTECRLAALRVV